jgi:hypothetical protein
MSKLHNLIKRYERHVATVKAVTRETSYTKAYDEVIADLKAIQSKGKCHA